MGERCTVEGTVQSVIFQNEENGYTVLSLAVDGQEEPVTVVGCIPCAAAGEGMTVTGVWVEHPSYGPQLTAESVERRLPGMRRTWPPIWVPASSRAWGLLRRSGWWSGSAWTPSGSSRRSRSGSRP